MIDLKKGQNVPLDKAAINLSEIQIGLGWDVKVDSTMKDEVDLDVFGLVVNASDDKGLAEKDIHYYGNVNGKGLSSDHAYQGVTDILAKAKELLTGSTIVITKDNRTGQGDGDDETLFVNSSNLAKDKKVIIVVNIYEADNRKQTFGMVNNSYCRIIGTDGKDFARYDLKEDFSIESGVIVGEIYWSADGSELKIRAIGKGFSGDINELSKQYT